MSVPSILQSILPLVPSTTFNQVVIPVLRITGKCIIPPTLLSGDSKLIVALKSDVDPSLAVSTTTQSLVFHGVVFQYLTSTKSWIIHSQFCGSHFSRDSCSLQSVPTLLGGGKSLIFQRSIKDMSSVMEHWTFRALSPSEYPVLPIIKVQQVFRDMYIQQNATIIGSLQQKFDIQSNQILSLLNQDLP